MAQPVNAAAQRKAEKEQRLGDIGRLMKTKIILMDKQRAAEGDQERWMNCEISIRAVEREIQKLQTKRKAVN